MYMNAIGILSAVGALLTTCTGLHLVVKGLQVVLTMEDTVDTHVLVATVMVVCQGCILVATAALTLLHALRRTARIPLAICIVLSILLGVVLLNMDISGYGKDFHRHLNRFHEGVRPTDHSTHSQSNNTLTPDPGGKAVLSFTPTAEDPGAIPPFNLPTSSPIGHHNHSGDVRTKTVTTVRTIITTTTTTGSGPPQNPHTDPHPIVWPHQLLYWLMGTGTGMCLVVMMMIALEQDQEAPPVPKEQPVVAPLQEPGPQTVRSIPALQLLQATTGQKHSLPQTSPQPQPPDTNIPEAKKKNKCTIL